MKICYYDAAFGIDGTAEDLFGYATRYTDDYTDEGLLKIIDILTKEGKTEEAQFVNFELESRKENESGVRDLGRLKVWAADGQYLLIDEEDHDAFFLTLVSGNGLMIFSVTGKIYAEEEPRTNILQMPLEEFYKLNAEEFERIVNSVWFYAQ